MTIGMRIVRLITLILRCSTQRSAPHGRAADNSCINWWLAVVLHFNYAVRSACIGG